MQLTHPTHIERWRRGIQGSCFALLLIVGAVGAEEVADPGPDAEMLTLQAQIQARNGEYADALDSFAAALEAIEVSEGVWDQSKVQVLLGLGDVYSDLDRNREALGHYQQALYINRMNQGLDDTSQLAALERIARAQVAVGEFQAANDIQ